jgi:hypothetical protein
MDQLSWRSTDKPSPTNAAFIPLTDKQAAEVDDEAAMEDAMEDAMASEEVYEAATNTDFRIWRKSNCMEYHDGFSLLRHDTSHEKQP